MIIVETHSDFLVDRVRQAVASGVISKDAVQILFFDKPKFETEIHTIMLDENGNVVNAPDVYRKFFLEEELNLFNRTSD